MTTPKQPTLPIALLGATCPTCGRHFAVQSYLVSWQPINLHTQVQTGVAVCSYKHCGEPVPIKRETQLKGIKPKVVTKTYPVRAKSDPWADRPQSRAAPQASRRVLPSTAHQQPETLATLLARQGY